MVELRKARATDTPLCECTSCCLGVSEWLYEMVAVRGHSQSISRCTKWWVYEVSLEALVDVVRVNCDVRSTAITRFQESKESLAFEQEQRRSLYKECMIQPPPFNKAVSHALPDWRLRFCVL